MKIDSRNDWHGTFWYEIFVIFDFHSFLRHQTESNHLKTAVQMKNSYRLFTRVWVQICHRSLFEHWITQKSTQTLCLKIEFVVKRTSEWFLSKSLFYLEFFWYLYSVFIANYSNFDYNSHHFCSGIFAYVKQISLLRFLGHFIYAYVKMDVIKITKHTEDSSIKVRWRITGITGYRILFKMIQFRVWDPKQMIEQHQKT